MDSTKIILALLLLSHSMIVKGTPINCDLVLCYLPANCIQIPANGQCCPKCNNGNRKGDSCKYEVGEGQDKVKVTIPDGKSKKIECNSCSCSDGVLACTKIGCAEP